MSKQTTYSYTERPSQGAAIVPVETLIADPDPTPPPRVLGLGVWQPGTIRRPPQRPAPVVRVQRRYAPNGMAIVDYDGVAWGSCSNHQHMRPLAEFYGPDRYGTMTLFRICAPCREQLRLRKREQRAQAKHAAGEW